MSLPSHTEIFLQQFEIFFILVKIALVFLFLLIAVAITDIGLGGILFCLGKLMYYSFKIFLGVWIVLFLWPTEIYCACFWFLALIFNSFVKAYQKLRTVEPRVLYSEHIQPGKLPIILCFLYKGLWFKPFFLKVVKSLHVCRVWLQRLVSSTAACSPGVLQPSTKIQK